MARNEGNLDRIIRVLVGAAAIAAALAVGIDSAIGILLVVVGAVMLVTAAVGFCPAYRLFGLSTCPVDARPTQRQPTSVG
jgi:hypothetical protein